MNLTFFRQFLCATIIFLLYSCSSMVGGSSVEFNSAKMYARVDRDLKLAEQEGLKALEIEPNNALIPYFLATEVYRPMKKYDKATQMFVEALSRTENLVLDRPFKVGEEYINNVHAAIKNEAFVFYNDGSKLYNKGKKSKAAAKFMVSMKLNPDILQNYIALSDIEYENGNLEKAMEYLDMGSKITSNTDLKIRKATIAKDNKDYTIALETLNQINTDDEELKMMIEKEIFLIYLDQEEYDTAINLGTELVEKMFNSLNVDDLILSETCYNVAICNRFVGYELYNSVLETVNSGTEDLDIIKEAISKGEKAIVYLENAKERFYDASSFNPDDMQSATYAKDLNKIIKQLKNLFLPSLNESLKKAANNDNEKKEEIESNENE